MGGKSSGTVDDSTKLFTSPGQDGKWEVTGRWFSIDDDRKSQKSYHQDDNGAPLSGGSPTAGGTYHHTLDVKASAELWNSRRLGQQL